MPAGSARLSGNDLGCNPPANTGDFAFLNGGKDGESPSLNDYKGKNGELATGLTAFEAIDEISLVAAPNDTQIDGLAAAIKTHCETQQDRFAVFQANMGSSDVVNLRPPIDSDFATFYYPWVKVIDPVYQQRKTVPPCGHIIGIYARNDTNLGVCTRRRQTKLRAVWLNWNIQSLKRSEI